MVIPSRERDELPADWLRFETQPMESLSLSRQLDRLYRLLLHRGGVRTPGAAIGELSKLLLVRIAVLREPNAQIEGYGTFASAITPRALRSEGAVELAKAAFRSANQLPSFRSRLPDGTSQTIWPADETLGITRRDVMGEAARVLWGVGVGGGAQSDLLGAALDIFVQRRGVASGEWGLFLTPGNVVDMMARIGFHLLTRSESDLRRGQLVGDPCCGSGRFLLALCNGLGEHIGHQQDAIGERLIGAERSDSLVAMTRVNLLASGMDQPQVYRVADSITSPHLAALRGQFGLVLTNPPFGDKQYDSASGIASASRHLPSLTRAKRIDPALAFFALCLDLLADGGVMGIVLPDGLLAGEALRGALLDTSRPQGLLVDCDQITAPVVLEGVVSLPPQTFAPSGTTVKTSVVFVRKVTRNGGGSAFLARAEHVGFIMRKGSLAHDPAGDDLPLIAREVEQSPHLSESGEGDTEFVTVVPRAELRSLDAAPARAAKAARRELLDQGGAEARRVLSYAGRNRCQHGSAFVSVLHVDEIGVIDWAAAERHDPITPGQTAIPGQIIVSLLNPSTFRAAVIPEASGPIQCSTEFGVFDAKIDPHAALVLLQHPMVRAQAAPLGRGSSSSRRRITAEDVLALVVPPFTEEWAAEVGVMVRNHYERIRGSYTALSSCFSSAGLVGK